MTLTNAERKKHAERIRALLAKTTLAGATEAEALAALAKAQELMAKYAIGSEALDAAAEGTLKVELSELDFYRFPIKRELCVEIAKFTNTRTWISTRDKTVTFFGLTSDVVFAEWLCDSLADFVKREATRYATAKAIEDFMIATPTSYRHFADACICRLNDRLRDLRLAANRANAASANALVVNRMAFVNDELAKLGLRLRRARSLTLRGHDSQARAAGWSSGANAGFSRPVGGTGGTRRITHTK